MRVRCAFNFVDRPDLGSTYLRVFALVIDVEQFARLSRIQKKSRWSNKLQGIPFGGIMTRGDRDAAVRMTLPHLQLHRRDRTHANVDNAAST